MERLLTTNHSLALSHYWPTRELLAAGFPLWPVSPLLRQPDPPGFPQEGHVDASLSADANSTWINSKQNPPPHISPDSGLPVAGLQEIATLPAKKSFQKVAANENFNSIVSSFCCSVKRKKEKKSFERDRTRTCNPQIRSLVPYPLGHTSYSFLSFSQRVHAGIMIFQPVLQ